jgi:hypothetical protein
VSDRDELTDLIMDVFDAHDEGHHSTALDAAQRILARWRLVPITDPTARPDTPDPVEWAVNIPRTAPRKPPFDPTNPAMISAVREYLEHGFDDATIMAVSFPGLTPEIIDALRTDQHGPHED